VVSDACALQPQLIPYIPGTQGTLASIMWGAPLFPARSQTWGKLEAMQTARNGGAEEGAKTVEGTISELHPNRDWRRRPVVYPALRRLDHRP
jgi:hypothetical protein